ncbi:MAG: ribosome small subunit-dependent GTPase A [Syntrophomonadaceae bacterium]|nr:ribosome small subunit-dependent GTPase A [Syntrophomonadaceae bacterium]
MLEGVLIRGYGGFYYIQAEGRVWVCSLRGRLRHQGRNILAGDRVLIRPLKGDRAVVEEIRPRVTELQRPPVANVEQVVIVISLVQPSPDRRLLDRLLVLTECSGIEPVVCLNKADLVPPAESRELAAVYCRAGYPVLVTSALEGTGMEELKQRLSGKLTVFAGPSGVGKSSLLNALQPGLSLRTGEVSRKIGRGRHTTRHVELLPLSFGGWVADTPGFSVVDLPRIRREELAGCFPELAPFYGRCQFNSCLHRGEPGCAVAEARRSGEIDPQRYENYLLFLEEVILQERKY